MAIDDPTLAQCFANLPQSENIPFELTYARIAAAQGEDAHLEQLIKDHPENYQTRMLAPDVTVRCYVANPSSAPDDWKIYLPQSLMDSAIRWYHLALCHAGMNRVFDSMSRHFYSRDLRNKIEDIIIGPCEICQKQKVAGFGYGHTAPREVS